MNLHEGEEVISTVPVSGWAKLLLDEGKVAVRLPIICFMIVGVREGSGEDARWCDLRAVPVTFDGGDLVEGFSAVQAPNGQIDGPDGDFESIEELERAAVASFERARKDRAHA